MSEISIDDLEPRDAIAILTVLLSYFIYSLGDATVKYTLQFYDLLPVMFLNSFFCMFFMLVYGLSRGGPKYFKTQKVKYHLIKGALGIVLGFAAVYALGHTTLSEFYLVIFTAPLWLVIFSMTIMKEKFDSFRSLMVVLGFSVIAYVFMPDGQLSITLGLAAGLLTAALVGFNMAIIRQYLRGEPTALIGGFNSTVLVVVIAVFAIPNLKFEMLKHLHYFAFTGFCILSGTVLLARAFHTASHSVILAPIHYVQMIYGVLLGYFIFSEVPSSRTLFGMLALAALGLCLFWYDYKNNKKKRRIYDTQLAKS